MTTLRQELAIRGHRYQSVFSGHAEDIYFNDADELCESLGFIVTHIARFDFETPENLNPTAGYSIANGPTASGHPMKYGRQYRIYFDTTYNMPQKLRGRLQKDNQNRITGSLFVEACSYLGFCPGTWQNRQSIINDINAIFNSKSERAAFAFGRTL